MGIIDTRVHIQPRVGHDPVDEGVDHGGDVMAIAPAEQPAYLVTLDPLW